MTKEKIYYIDNLRVLLTALVVLHHSFVTYGAPGGWYYLEKTTHVGALIPMTFFVSVNQSFFMGFFFFLSALFLESSLKRKGTRQFIADRLKRLGIPLIFYSLILSPFVDYLVDRFGNGEKISLWQYLHGFHHWVDFGVLWFVAALLIFTLLYTLIRPLIGPKPEGLPLAGRISDKQAAGSIIQPKPSKCASVPSNRRILLFAFGLGIISYLVRIFFPVGWILQPFGFQLAHFSQYIALFALGITAARYHWLDQFDIKKAKPFLIVAIVFILIGFPLLYVLKAVTGSSIADFVGGGTYQSFLSAGWEQITGISIIVVLLGYGRQKWSGQSPLLKNMARSAYGVYIIHPLVLVCLSLLFMNLPVDPAVKLLFVGPLAVIGSFLTGAVLVKIPGVKNTI
jgi:surface polysaccharide O-acyltransferase-like enzyme